MLFFAVICGLSVLGGFLLQRFGAPPLTAVPFSVMAHLRGGKFSSIQLAGELRRGAFDINLLMIVVAIGAACVGVWTEGDTFLFLRSAALGHEGSTVLVVLNGLRVLRLKPGHST